MAGLFAAADNPARMTTRFFTFGLACALLATVAGNYLLETPASAATARTLLTYGPEGARLLGQAGALVEVNILEDPSYRVAGAEVAY